MRSGTLDTLVRLQRQGPPVDDGLTQVPGPWADLAGGPVWASERSAPGQERLANAENAGSQVTVFRIRWDPALDHLNNRDRLIREEDGEVFNILGVQRMGRQDGIEISAITRTDD